MAHTDHHRKPGAERPQPKQHLACGRADAAMRLALLTGVDVDTLPTFEPTHERRTR